MNGELFYRLSCLTSLQQFLQGVHIDSFAFVLNVSQNRSNEFQNIISVAVRWIYCWMTNEGTFLGVTRRLTRLICHLIELNESSSRCEMFVPIRSGSGATSFLSIENPLHHVPSKIES